MTWRFASHAASSVHAVALRHDRSSSSHDWAHRAALSKFRFLFSTIGARLENVGLTKLRLGNFYSIENETEHDAKLFFAQGCEVDLSVMRNDGEVQAQP